MYGSEIFMIPLFEQKQDISEFPNISGTIRRIGQEINLIRKTANPFRRSKVGAQYLEPDLGPSK
jgi:hypothetical protein